MNQTHATIIYTVPCAPGRSISLHVQRQEDIRETTKARAPGATLPKTRRQKRQPEAFSRRERLPLLRPASEAARFGEGRNVGGGGDRGRSPDAKRSGRRPSPHGDAHQWRGADAPSPRGALGGRAARRGSAEPGHVPSGASAPRGRDIDSASVVGRHGILLRAGRFGGQESEKSKLAEREGFEPSIRDLVPYDGLANRCLQPLGHLSNRLIQDIMLFEPAIA